MVLEGLEELARTVPMARGQLDHLDRTDRGPATQVTKLVENHLIMDT